MVPWQMASHFGIEPFNSQTGVPAMYWGDGQWSGVEHSAMHGYNSIGSDTKPLVKPSQLGNTNLNAQGWMDSLERHYSNPDLKGVRGDLHIINADGTKGPLLARNVSPAEAWEKTKEWGNSKRSGC